MSPTNMQLLTTGRRSLTAFSIGMFGTFSPPAVIIISAHVQREIKPLALLLVYLLRSLYLSYTSGL
jgi:hypothetical protein